MANTSQAPDLERVKYQPISVPSSPLDNRAHPMANTSQAPDLEGLHREIHAPRRGQSTASGHTSHPDIERSHHSHRLGDDHSQNRSTGRVRRGRRRSPSPPRHESSSSLKSRLSSKTQEAKGEEVRRGRSPRRNEQTRRRNTSTSQKIRDLDARLDAINTGASAPVIVDALIRQTESPFTKRVLRARVSSRFKLPTQLGTDEGKTNPMDHLDSYKSLMSLQGCSDEVMCKAFLATLKGSARSWFRKLPLGTIDLFGDLSRLFVANFMSCRIRQKNAYHRFIVRQKDTKGLKDYVKRFNQAILEVEDPSDKVVIMAMMEGIWHGPLFDSLFKNVPKIIRHSRARLITTSPPRNWPKPSGGGGAEMIKKERSPKPGDLIIRMKQRAGGQIVLTEIKHEKFVKWPAKIKPDPRKRDKSKICDFHQDHGHNTKDCFQLKELVADLVKKGYFRKYVADHPPPSSPERRYGDNRPTAGDIQVIHGGFGSGGCSNSSRKRHARNANGRAKEEVYNISSQAIRAHRPICFTNDDLRGLHLPHDDALVISAIIANFNV
ncbi:uncharacterized protein LOC130766092 [Actinidia eriantha]|uniref:uncharacterized protein LOC130766092 n=1 Tax=Actinidia eriantha TaxID=165200 RepID=UPI00258F733D|nr:uncharacterized protein LOC130766092 [Actinidia eriantha]